MNKCLMIIVFALCSCSHTVTTDKRIVTDKFILGGGIFVPATYEHDVTHEKDTR